MATIKKNDVNKSLAELMSEVDLEFFEYKDVDKVDESCDLIALMCDFEDDEGLTNENDPKTSPFAKASSKFSINDRDVEGVSKLLHQKI